MKWYNALSFEEKDDGYIAISGTKQSIERAFGNDGKAYFEKFILDLNGSSDSKNAGGAGEETLIRNFKVAAVGANMRVAIQQPTAYLRAAAVMDPKYLLKGLFSKPASKEAIDNCPIAKWKSWGFYETSMGITMKQLITGQQTTVDKIREKSMWLAGVGDELTWGTLWKSKTKQTLKRELQSSRRQSQTGSVKSLTKHRLLIPCCIEANLCAAQARSRRCSAPLRQSLRSRTTCCAMLWLTTTMRSPV